MSVWAPCTRFVPGTLLLLLLAAPALEAQAPAAAVGEVEEAAAGITADRVFGHLYVLASDGMRGRDTPSPGLEASAAYLVSRHRAYGLEPAGEDGTFYQRYPFRLVGLDVDEARVALVGPGGRIPVALGEEGFLRGGSEEPLDGPVVFADDLADVTPEPGALEGKVLMARLPGAWGQELWSNSLRQASFADEAGARAVVHVLDADFPTAAVQQLAEGLAQPQWRLGDDRPFPQVFVRAGAVEAALAGAEPDWNDFSARVDPGEGSRRGPADLELTGRMPLEVLESATPPNVVAKLPGSDPRLRDEYIVLSAHFDHVGVGEPMNGDSIYNGADDNASGTTTLLEVARALASLPEAPRRTVVFAHVSGEEKGLLGSRWFVDNPTVPIENVVANINADMVGSDTHPDTVVIIGKEYSDLGPLVNEVNAGLPDLSLVTSPDLWPEERLFYRSDQYNFMRKEIPSLFFFTGLHECYHRPCDTVDFVDPDKIARIARLITHTVVEIANRDPRPEWDPAGLEEVREMVAGGR
jgi:hypothetical protein